MGKKLFALICFIGILVYLFLGISFVLAATAADCTEYCNDQTLDPPSGRVCLCPPTSATSIEVLLDNVINYIFLIATAITPILIIVGGFYFITSAGSVDKVTKAKNIITYTIIGYAIVLFARGLVYILADLLGR